MLRKFSRTRGFGTKSSVFGAIGSAVAIASRAVFVSILVFVGLTVFGLQGQGGQAFAQSVSNAPVIFDVRRSLPLEPDEPVYHDFYINAGPEAGFKKGLYVSVVRQVPVHDPIQNKQQATLNIGIGKLQIIHVEKGITVGRLYSEASNDERPTVEFEAIMIGDKVDPSSLSSEAPGQKKKPRARAAKVQESRIETAEAAPAPVAPAAQPAPPASVPAPQVQPLQKLDPPKAELEPSMPPTTSPASIDPDPYPSYPIEPSVPYKSGIASNDATLRTYDPVRKYEAFYDDEY